MITTKKLAGYMSMSDSADHSDSTSGLMICADCFRTKGESQFSLSCRNPKCYFFARNGQNGQFTPPTQPFTKETVDKWSRHSDELRGEGSWGHRPVPLCGQSKSQRDSITSADTINSYSLASSTQETRRKTKSIKVHDRAMSTPASGSFFFQDDTDLVEDAFLSSPVSTAADRIELGGFLSPDSSYAFKKSSCMLDWLYAKPSMVPSGSRVFDMTSLKMEMPALEDGGPGSTRASPVSACKSRTSLPSPNLFPSETYSRKVFIGGLPQDVAEEDIWTFFLRFGALTVDWPHKTHTRGSIPPKGYAFLLFRDELSVHSVLKSCVCEGDKFFLHIPTLSVGRKKVQVRPWCIADSQCLLDSRALDQRRAVFVGGVPRPLKALELAQVMNEKYGNVSFVAIDCDSELKYPKGAACVVFTSHSSYIAAVSARFMQLSYGDMEKKIEIKPYVLDGQLCDECHGVQSDRKPAPFFCGSMTCLKYYCEHCWATVHSMPNWQNHRPLLKDVGDHVRFH